MKTTTKTMKTTKTLLTIGAVAGLSFTTAQAATLVWDDDGPGEDWSTVTNWVGDSASPANGDSVELTQRNVLDYAFTVESGQSVTDTVGSNWLGLGNDGWTGGAAAELTLASGGSINVGTLSPRGNNATLFPTITIEDGASLTTVNGLDASRSSYLVWEAGVSSVTTWNTTNFTSTLASTTVDLTDPLVGPLGTLTLVDYSGTGTGTFSSETITSAIGSLTLGADPGGDPFALNAGEYFIDYGSGTNDSITLFYYVPEPSSTALLGLGSLALMLRRKRS